MFLQTVPASHIPADAAELLVTLWLITVVDVTTAAATCRCFINKVAESPDNFTQRADKASHPGNRWTRSEELRL